MQDYLSLKGGVSEGLSVTCGSRGAWEAGGRGKAGSSCGEGGGSLGAGLEERVSCRQEDGPGGEEKGRGTWERSASAVWEESRGPKGRVCVVCLSTTPPVILSLHSPGRG